MKGAERHGEEGDTGQHGAQDQKESLNLKAGKWHQAWGQWVKTLQCQVTQGSRSPNSASWREGWPGHAQHAG